MPAFSRFTAALIPAIALCTSARAALTLNPIEDNNTLKSAADTVQATLGASAGMLLKQSDNTQSNSRTGFFKFDAPASLAAANGSSATFSISTTAAAGTTYTIAVFALNTGVTGYNWAENTITWNNSPALGLSANNYLDPTKVTNVGTFTIANNAAAGQFGLTFSNWTNYVQVDGSITLIAVITNQTSQTPTLGIGTSESATGKPELTLIPEPSTPILSVLAASAFLRRRR